RRSRSERCDRASVLMLLPHATGNLRIPQALPSAVFCEAALVDLTLSDPPEPSEVRLRGACPGPATLATMVEMRRSLPCLKSISVALAVSLAVSVPAQDAAPTAPAAVAAFRAGQQALQREEFDAA